jgi:predicted ester cyclase
MSEEIKTKQKQAWYEAWNQGNLDALDEVLAPNYVRHKPPFADIVGLEGQKDFIKNTRASYPDVKLSFQKQLIEGDWIATLWTWEGTQRGVSIISGAPPSNKYVKFQGCSLVRMEDGKEVEEWELGDYLGLMQQLGVVPEFS